MSSEPAADHLVAGRIDAAARVAGSDGTHAFEVLEDGLRAPKAATGEDSGLLGLACGEWSIDHGLWERVTRFSGGTSAYRADSVPR
jgi:hypothetical protein